MLRLALLLVAAASLGLVGCKTVDPPTQTTPISPRSYLPPLTEAPDISRVGEEVGHVRDTNTQLRSEIVWYRKQTDGLTSNLRQLEAAGIATKEELTSVREQSERMQSDLERVNGIVDVQREEITMLEEDVTVQGALVQRITAERDTLRVGLQTANDNLDAMTKENEAVKLEGDQARAVAAKLEGEIKSERKWKWNFFWIALGASTALVGSWAIYFYLKLKSPF